MRNPDTGPDAVKIQPDPRLAPRPRVNGQRSLGTAMEKLRHRWGWFVGAGRPGGGARHRSLSAIDRPRDHHHRVHHRALHDRRWRVSEIMVGLNAKDLGPRDPAGSWRDCSTSSPAPSRWPGPCPAAVVLTLMLGSDDAGGGCDPYLDRRAHAFPCPHHGDRRRCGDGAWSASSSCIGWPANSLVILGTLLGIGPAVHRPRCGSASD